MEASLQNKYLYYCCGQLWVRHMICGQTCDELSPLEICRTCRTCPAESCWCLAKGSDLAGHFVQHDSIFAGINWEKCLTWGSKCLTEQWRPTGHFVRQTQNNFREDWVAICFMWLIMCSISAKCHQSYISTCQVFSSCIPSTEKCNIKVHVLPPWSLVFLGEDFILYY